MTVKANSKARITVTVASMLRLATDGRAEFEVEAATLADAFEAAFAAHPGLRVHLFDEAGDLRPHVLCLIDGQNVRWFEDWERPFDEPTKTLDILQAVSGG